MNGIKMTLLNFEDISPKVLKLARASTTFYAEKFLGLYPYLYQQGFLDDQHWVYNPALGRQENLFRFKIATFSRQLGKTFAVSIKASQKINMFPGHHVGITAQNEKRAFEIYEAVRGMQRMNPALETLLAPKNDLKSQMTLDLFNDAGQPSRVTYYAAGTHGKSIRGATIGTLLMDEADYVARAVYAATIPTISATGGEIYLTSTPGDQIGSMFHNIFVDAWDARLKHSGLKDLAPGETPFTLPIGRKYDFVGYHYDYTHGLEVTNPITGLKQIDYKVVNIIKNDNYAQYEREYLAKWSAEGSTYFSQNSIVSQTVENNWRLDPIKHRPFRVAGIDWGRMKDYTGVVVFEVNDARDMMVAIRTYQVRRKSWEVIFSNVVDILREEGVSEVVHDKKNVGDTMHVWLQKVSGGGMHFALRGELMDTVPKAQMYANAKMGMDMGRIFHQKKHTTLITELQHMISEDSHITRAQSIHAPENKFDDLADAYVLGSSVIRFQMIHDDREVDAVPHHNFFDVYEKPNHGDVWADIQSVTKNGCSLFFQ